MRESFRAPGCGLCLNQGQDAKHTREPADHTGFMLASRSLAHLLPPKRRQLYELAMLDPGAREHLRSLLQVTGPVDAQAQMIQDNPVGVELIVGDRLMTMHRMTDIAPEHDRPPRGPRSGRFINVERRTLVVRRRVQSTGGKGLVIPPLKSAAICRTVKLPDITCGVLSEQRTAYLEIHHTVGTEGQDNDRVFNRRTGTPLDRTNVDSNHLRGLEDAGLPHVRIHDFRYTAATRYLEQGESPKIVQERLGHSNISQTFGTYSHVRPAVQGGSWSLDGLFSDRARRGG